MSLVTVAIIALVLWIGAFAFYLYTSRQHSRIESELEKVRTMLADREQLTEQL